VPDPESSGRKKRERKWGYYPEDIEALKFARRCWPPEDEYRLPERCLEAEIMDWADDLTYAVHDVDDFFRAGLVPLDRLAQPMGVEMTRFRRLLIELRDEDVTAFPEYSVEELVHTVETVLDDEETPKEPYRHTVEARAKLRQWTIRLVEAFQEAFHIEEDVKAGGARVRIDPELRLQVEALKMLVVVYVIRRPGLAVVQRGQQRLIEELFNIYFDASEPEGLRMRKSNRSLFPPTARDRLLPGKTGTDRARVVVDLISGLTEATAIQLHSRLTGAHTAPTLDAVAHIG
jgi:dGTPase